jgi:cellulose biosynthesis protein BcsQ/tetratricopeptide (TPR) repeat protein
MRASATTSASTITVSVAPVSRVGRTSALVNAAWNLAVADRRVLVVDADSGGSPVTGYFEPYRSTVGQISPALDPRVENALSSWSDDRTGPVRPRSVTRGAHSLMAHHRLPDGVSALDVLTLPDTGLWTSPAGPRVIRELRRALRLAPYDHVLIELPARPDEHALADAVELADHVVVCLRAIPSQVSAARNLRVQLLQTVSRRGLVRPRISGIVTFLAPAQAQARGVSSIVTQVCTTFVPEFTMEEAAGTAFHALGGDGALFVPFRSVEAGSPLGVLFPEERERPWAGPGWTAQAPAHGPVPDPVTAYRLIAETIAGAPLPPTPAVSPHTRERYRRAIGLRGPTAPVDLTVVHHPVDRPMVEWMKDSLEPQGISLRGVWLHDDIAALPTGSAVMVLEEPGESGPVSLPQGVEDRIRVWSDCGPEARRGQDPPADLRPSEDAEVIDLRGLTGDVAAQVLTRRLGIPARAPDDPDQDEPGRRGPRSEPRFPPDQGRAVRRSFLPRNEFFVGRDRELDELRDALSPSSGLLRWMVHGPAGVGKSELAREYTHRFACAYDFVWWIEAVDAQAVRRSLNALGRSRSVRAEGDLPRAALRDLAGTSDRWLLVYDGVTDPVVLRELIPTNGHGHILITSRNQLLPGSGESVLGGLSDQDAAALVHRRARDLQDDLTDLVLQTVGLHPVVVDLSSRWLASALRALRSRGVSGAQACDWAARELIERHRMARKAPTAVPDADPVLPADLACAVSATMTMLLGRLERDTSGRLATTIARFCTRLSCLGANFQLLSAPAMLEQIALSCGENEARELRTDSALLHQALWTGRRLGLLDLSWGNRIRLRSRDLMESSLTADLSPQDRRLLNTRVLRGLAGAAPTDAAGDDAARRPRLEELGRHLVPSEASDSDEDDVRRWFLRQVRHHYLTGDVEMRRTVLDLAVSVRERWTARFPSGDPALLRLGTQVANLYRALGDDGTALRIGREVIAAARRDLGITHPRTLMAARGLAADLRGMGCFIDSLAEDHSAWRGFRQVYGDDHLDTLRAEHNLSLSLGLAGRTQEAARRGALILEKVRQILGTADPLAWQCAVQLAGVHRELGKLDQALHELQTALEDLRRAPDGPDQGFDLLLSNGICVVKRDMGTWPAALSTHEQVLADYRALHGDDHGEVLGCRLGLAGHHHVRGHSGVAVRQGQECLTRLESTRGPEHPFTATCRSTLGLFLRNDGAPDRAVELGSRAVQDLQAKLGPGHLWTIAARMILAGSLAEAGDLRSAESIEQNLVLVCRTLLVRTHPYAVGCVGNLALTRGSHGLREERTERRIAVRTDPLVEIPQT